MASLKRGNYRILLIAAWFLFAGTLTSSSQSWRYSVQGYRNKIVSMAPNKIQVNVPGYQWDDFDFSVSNGTVTKKEAHCVIRPELNTDTMILTIRLNNRVLGQRHFKVDNVFDMLKAYKTDYYGIYLGMKNGESPPPGFELTDFHTSVVRNGYVIKNYFSSEKFHKKGKAFIRKSLRKGDVIYYTNIQVSAPGYDANYSLDPVKFTK